MPRNIERRRGCADPVKCGDTCKTCTASRSAHPPYAPQDHAYIPQGAHICGGTDLCSFVRPVGEVCTFGTLSGAPYYTQAEIDAEADAIDEAIASELVRGGAAPNIAAAKGLLTATEKARTRAEVRKGKNVWSAQAEAATLAAADKHFTDNKTLHDTNPSVFHG